jgi:aromatic ring-cleaving dioxygenase
MKKAMGLRCRLRTGRMWGRVLNGDGSEHSSWFGENVNLNRMVWRNNRFETGMAARIRSGVKLSLHPGFWPAVPYNANCFCRAPKAKAPQIAGFFRVRQGRGSAAAAAEQAQRAQTGDQQRQRGGQWHDRHLGPDYVVRSYPVEVRAMYLEYVK